MKCQPIFCLLLLLCTLVHGQNDNYSFVNPFIGTAGHGHTYPGAVLPHGFVQLSPDTDDSGWDWSSGYHYSDSTIMGFSHTHLSGTGISDLADILIMPYCQEKMLDYGAKDSQDGLRSIFRHASEVAQPGYYRVELEKYGILAELTVDNTTGYHRYTFPKTDSAHIAIDLQHGLDRHRTWLTERVLDAEIRQVDSVTLQGFRKSTGWANIQEVYFQIKFSQGIHSLDIAQNDVLREHSQLGRGRNVKAIANFQTKADIPLELYVSISTKPFGAYIPRHASFESAWRTARETWEKQLSQVHIKASKRTKTNFLTALYHASLAPNRLIDLQHPDTGQLHFESSLGTLSQWDVYRAAFAWNILTKPAVVTATMGTMLRSAKANHYLPVWNLWGDEVNCMIGTPSIPMVCEAFEKGRIFDTGLANEKEAFKEALKRSLLLDNPVAPWSLLDKYGYVPVDKHELFAVSKTLEMAYASACALLFFEKYYPEDDIIFKLKERASSYQNLFDLSDGFFKGKNTDGTWVENFDPTKTDIEAFVEATPWQYLFHVQHDIPALIKMMGGKQEFATKLDALFAEKKVAIDEHILDITGLIGQYAHGNEPSHHVAYLYNDVQQAWKTQALVHRICSELYSDTPQGLCGNEDCGQMSAWYLFSALGFYPVHPISGQYYIGKPMVERAELMLANKKSLVIQVENYNPDYRYVKSVFWNNTRLSSPYISHEALMKGGTLTFTLSEKEVYDCYDDFRF